MWGGGGGNEQLETEGKEEGLVMERVDERARKWREVRLGE